VIGFTGSLTAARGSRFSMRWRLMKRFVIGSPRGAE
jgi:hypothetical protein